MILLFLESSHNEGQQLRASTVDKATLVLSSRGRYVVVGEGVSPAVGLNLVDNAAVVVHRPALHRAVVGLVIPARREGWLNVSTRYQQSGTVDGRAQPRHHREMDLIVGRLKGEGPGVAPEDIPNVRLRVAAVVAGTLQLIALYTAGDIARGSLSVDDEVVVAVVVPGVVDQPAKVGSKRIRHLTLVDGRADHSDEVTAGAIRTQLIPRASIYLLLCLEPVADLSDPVRRKSEHLLVRSIRLL